MARKCRDCIIAFLPTWAERNESKWEISKPSALQEKIFFKTTVTIFSIQSVRLNKSI